MLKSTLKFRTLIRTVIVLISIYFFQNHVNAQGYWEQSQLNGQLNMLGWGMVSYGGDSTLTYIEYKIIYVSKDNGISFKPKHQFEDSGNISSTQTVTDSMIICSWNYYLTVSYDAGSSWDTMKIKTQMGDTISYFPIHFYYFWRNGKAIIISRPDSYNQDSCYNIYLSDDYGNTWNKKDCSELNISEINSENKGGLGPRKYNVVDDKIFLQHPNSRNKMLRIYDYGNRIEEYTWDRDIYFEVFDLAFLDSLNGIAVVRERNGNRDLIFFKTEDGGTTFEKINLPYESFSKYFNIICSAKSTPKVEGFYLIAGYADDPVIVSYDYGNTWIDTYMPDFNTSAGVVRFKNSEYGFGVFSNRITKAKGYYYRDYRSLGVKEEVFNANTKIFPVPTTSEINVLGIENANYTIQDMSGRTIQNGFFEKSINVKELKQGVYILTISNDNQRYVKKIVKE